MLTDRSINHHVERRTNLRAGAVQLNSTEDTDRNLATADRLVRDAAARGAELVVLPEKWSVLGTAEQMARGCASRSTAAAIELGAVGRARARDRPRRRARSSSASPAATKPSNTSVHVGPDGELRAVYRKIHMFDVEVDGVVYAESRTSSPATRWSSRSSRTALRLGMSICYDLRFPELYRDPRRPRRAR